SIRVTGHSARKTNNAPTPATRSMRPSQGLRARPCASWLSARDVRRLVARNGSVVSSLHCMNDPRPEGHMASYIQRRKFLATLGGAAVAWPLTAHAQQPARVPTVGFLVAGTPSTHGQWLAAFVRRLGELGWVEGRNIAIEVRWAEGHSGRLAEIAREFVRLKVDV